MNYIETFGIRISKTFITITKPTPMWVAINRRTITKIEQSESGIIIESEGGVITLYNSKRASNNIYIK